jgi:hypothetical protein
MTWLPKITEKYGGGVLLFRYSKLDNLLNCDLVGKVCCEDMIKVSRLHSDLIISDSPNHNSIAKGERGSRAIFAIVNGGRGSRAIVRAIQDFNITVSD